MGVGVEVGGKGEGVRVGERGVEVGDGIMIVGVVVGKVVGVEEGAQAARSNNSEKATNARFITKLMILRGGR
jgi:hypothetical protein